MCCLIFSSETHCWFLTVTLAEAKQRGVKVKAKKTNVERDRLIEREKEREITLQAEMEDKSGKRWSGRTREQGNAA